jgi:hypothetical protein
VIKAEAGSGAQKVDATQRRGARARTREEDTFILGRDEKVMIDKLE